MEKLQDYMGSEGYPNSEKTLYKDLAVLRDFGIRYDYQKKAYILPFPSKKQEGNSNLNRALAENKQVSFRPFQYTTDRDEPKKYSNKGQPIEASPWKKYTRDGKDYVYMYLGEKKGFRTYRIDRLDDIILLDRRREGEDAYRAELKTAKHYKKEEVKVFNSYKGKESCAVRLRFVNTLLPQVYDEFGDDVVIIRDPDEKHFSITYPISISPTFYAWVATFGRKIRIEYPPQVIEGFKEFLHKSLDMYKD